MTNRTGRSWIALLLVAASVASQATMAACGGILSGRTSAVGTSDAHAAHAAADAPGASRTDAYVNHASHADADVTHASQTDGPTHAPQRCGPMMSCGAATPAALAGILAPWPPTDFLTEASTPAARVSFLDPAEPPPPRLLLI